MGDSRVDVSEYGSEEKTEPFSQTEYSARLQSLLVHSNADHDTPVSVSLDELVVPPEKDIRLLVRPLRSRSVSPGTHDNCELLALRAEVSNSQQQVLAVTQTSKDIKFSVRVPGERLGDGSPQDPLWCELYYDPASDNQILLNRSDVPITLLRMSREVVAGPTVEFFVVPGTIRALSPGTWRIRVDEAEVLDFRIIEKRPAVLVLPSNSYPAVSDQSGPTLNSSGKRSFVADETDVLGPEIRRVRSADTGRKDDDGVIMFLQPSTSPLVFPLPTASTDRSLAPIGNQPLLTMRKEETVSLPGGCEMDSYQLTKRDPIASTSLSSVFTASTTHSRAPPDSVITVKVLKTRPAQDSAGPLSRPQELERNVIRQADVWLREYQYHECLQHDSIVRLYGGDARHLSLYMEHVNAKDLSSRGTWRAQNSEYFTGTRHDAMQILRGVSGALQYLHGQNLVHNDIKPANILYSAERGAVLCDFGLSTHADNPATTGGTPYYVPPEFIGRKLRGAPSDVWALGITMLYVLRKIALPDSRGRPQHPKKLYWLIADLNKTAGPQGHQDQSATGQMRTWLSEVNVAKENLDRRDKLESMVAQMLNPVPSKRITMRKMFSEMFSEPPG